MPSKKRKYNARFPAGRIKKIMQTDEDVGKVAQAVPIIISRTLELFVESLLSKALQVTVTRNAKTLSPSHVKQCILAESRFDFLRDLVKNVPDVSAAEEKEMMSAESSPNSSRFSDMTVQPPRRVARQDSNSSSSCDVKTQQLSQPIIKRDSSHSEMETPKTIKTETVTSTTLTDTAIDLSKKTLDDKKPIRTANFYNETLLTDDVPHKSVITVNPSYSCPQPSTSYTTSEIVHKIEIPKQTLVERPIVSPRTPVTPIINIDFTKNLANPEIKLLDTAVANIVNVPKEKYPLRQIHRQNSKPKLDVKKVEIKPTQHPVDIDSLNSGNLQIDEDYDT